LLVGIRVERMLMVGWGLAAVVGFVAASLVAPQLFLSPTMMAPVLIYALASATLGGWDSPLGALLGGLLVGMVESVGATFLTFIGAELRLAIPIAVTLVVLFIRPAGLFGRQEVVRV
jgi:branched-chain amino acid transport system permease protein